MTHGLGSHSGVWEWGLKLGILLALRFRQGPNILFQQGKIFGFAVAASRRIVEARHSRTKFISPEFHRLSPPTKHPFRSP